MILGSVVEKSYLLTADFGTGLCELSSSMVYVKVYLFKITFLQGMIYRSNLD